MNRREFIVKALVCAPLVAALPVAAGAGDGVALRSIAHPYNPPKTVAELTRLIEALFPVVEMMAPAAFVEFAQITGGLAEVPTYRMVPVTWRMSGESEAGLVEHAWRDMYRVALESPSGTLFWRKKPEVVTWNDFESGERMVVLRFRAGLLPDDWVERARRGVSQKFWFDGVQEGVATPVLGA